MNSVKTFSFAFIHSFYWSNVRVKIICLFVCFELQEQFFSYLVVVIIAGDRAANLDLC
jgi:hypothetical protein